MNHRTLRRVAAASLCAILTAVSSPAPGVEAARVAPQDAFLLLSAPSIDGMLEAVKKTPTWGLYKDPAMQEFVVPTEAKIREKIHEALSEAWEGLELESPPEEIPWPSGQVALVMRMGFRTIRVPVYDWEAWDGEGQPAVKEYREQKVSAPHTVMLADMGEKIDEARNLVNQLAGKAADSGWKRERTGVRGVDVHVLTPPKPTETDGAPAMPQYNKRTAYALSGSTVILGDEAELVKDVVARLAGASAPAMADDQGYVRVMGKLAERPQARFYLNISRLLQEAKAQAGAEQAAQATRQMEALGFDNVVGLGATIEIAPGPRRVMRLRALLGVRGEKRGLLAALAPSATPVQPPRLVTRDVAGFGVLNYDVPKVFDRLAAVLQAVSGMPVDQQIQQMMAMTSQGTDQPPVNFRRDVVGQMTGPLAFVSRLDESTGQTTTLAAIPVRDAAVLDTAIGRIHSVLAGGQAETRRKLQGVTIYLVPPQMGAMLPMMAPFQYGPGREPMTPQGDPGAFAVAGGRLLIGALPTVEQAIRDIGREDVESVTADEMYQHAVRQLPSQAGGYFYQNERKVNAAQWKLLRTAAAGEQQPGMPATPMRMMVEQFSEYVDFATLPPYSEVAKYFGAAVGYVSDSPEGIYAEMISVPPPAAE